MEIAMMNQTEEKTPWRCPACNAPHSQEVRECMRCGIVVAKFTDKLSSHVDKGLRETVSVGQPTASSVKAWMNIVGGAIVLLAVIAGGAKWLTSRSVDRPEASMRRHQAAAPLMLRFTAENFQSDVVAASETKPVLIEFYSDT
jgi:hypothetical protein